MTTPIIISAVLILVAYRFGYVCGVIDTKQKNSTPIDGAAETTAIAGISKLALTFFGGLI